MNVQNIEKNQTPNFDNTQSDVEIHSLQTSTELEGKPLGIKIERAEFVATSWAGFKQQAIYQLKIEFELLKDYRNWIYILLGFVIIYFHVVAHNVAYYFSEPRPPLKDMFHNLIPALDMDSFLFKMNTYILYIMYVPMAIYGFSVFFVKYPTILRRTAVGLINRYFMVINIAQVMRMTTFIVTQIPAPNPECQPPYYDPPKTIKDLFLSSAGSGDRGCGDLIFSSHILFGLMNVLILIKYAGLSKHERIEYKFNISSFEEQTNADDTFADSPKSPNRINRREKGPTTIILVSKGEYYLRTAVVAFMVMALLVDIVLILAARKHYSVDIVLSVYITYMVWNIMSTRYADMEIPAHMAK